MEKILEAIPRILIIPVGNPVIYTPNSSGYFEKASEKLIGKKKYRNYQVFNHEKYLLSTKSNETVIRKVNSLSELVTLIIFPFSCELIDVIEEDLVLLSSSGELELWSVKTHSKICSCKIDYEE